MRRNLLISHGNMAVGLKDTLSVFIGDTSAYTSISAYTNDTDPKKELEQFFGTVSDEDQVFIFSDIMAGSVNQLVMPYIARKNTYLFTGMNLPMLLQAMCISEEITEDEIEKVIENAKAGVIYMNNYQFAINDDDE